MESLSRFLAGLERHAAMHITEGVFLPLHACTCMETLHQGLYIYKQGALHKSCMYWEAGKRKVRTHVLDLDATDGVHKGHGEPVAGDGAQASSDGASGSGLEDLVVHLLRALAGALVLGAKGGDLHMQMRLHQLGLN